MWYARGSVGGSASGIASLRSDGEKKIQECWSRKNVRGSHVRHLCSTVYAPLYCMKLYWCGKDETFRYESFMLSSAICWSETIVCMIKPSSFQIDCADVEIALPALAFEPHQQSSKFHPQEKKRLMAFVLGI